MKNRFVNVCYIQQNQQVVIGGHEDSTLANSCERYPQQNLLRMADFSVFTSNTTVIDKRVWNLFLLGLNAQQAIEKIDPEENKIAPVVITQYRNFEMIEHYLTHPKTLATQLIFSLSLTTRMTLISSYYRIDSRICRELLGKKLTHRIRKDLDDIAYRTRRSLLLCRRVFDNLKRITKRVEDAEEDMIYCIMNNFLLSQELASQYAHIIFINHYKFDTTKRKLAQLSFADYEYAASILLKYFPASSSSALEELDSVIVEDCRLLKIALFNHKDVLDRFRLALLRSLDDKELCEKINVPIFKNMIRNILAIGSSLSNSKEIRDLFLTIVERIVEPCILNQGWSAKDLEGFIKGLIGVLQSGPDFAGVSKYFKTFNRLFTAVLLVSIRFMNSFSS